MWFSRMSKARTGPDCFVISCSEAAAPIAGHVEPATTSHAKSVLLGTTKKFTNVRHHSHEPLVGFSPACFKLLPNGNGAKTPPVAAWRLSNRARILIFQATGNASSFPHSLKNGQIASVGTVDADP